MQITTRIDRMGAFKALPNRAEAYTLRALRPTSSPQGALAATPDDISALTSEGTPGRTTGHGEGAPEADPSEAQANKRPDAGEDGRRRLAFDLYFDLRGAGSSPSQNAFEKAWREAGYGLKTDDIRALYKDIHTKVTGNNA
jgi:hypothetical protein